MARPKETPAQARERQVREAFVDGYSSAMDHHSAGMGENTIRAEAERVWREENVTS